jgi:hypothetical protein
VTDTVKLEKYFDRINRIFMICFFISREKDIWFSFQLSVNGKKRFATLNLDCGMILTCKHTEKVACLHKIIFIKNKWLCIL